VVDNVAFVFNYICRAELLKLPDRAALSFEFTLNIAKIELKAEFYTKKTEEFELFPFIRQPKQLVFKSGFT